MQRGDIFFWGAISWSSSCKAWSRHILSWMERCLSALGQMFSHRFLFAHLWFSLYECVSVFSTRPIASFVLLSDFLSPALFSHVSSVNCVLAVLQIILFQRWAGNEEMSRRGQREKECVLCGFRWHHIRIQWWAQGYAQLPPLDLLSLSIQFKALCEWEFFFVLSKKTEQVINKIK